MPDGLNICGYVGKIIIIALALLGLILSGTSSSGCDFLQFKNTCVPREGTTCTADDELMPPFEGALEANVGINKYEIVAVDASGATTTSCDDYDSKFEFSFEVLATAQIVSICAPVFAALGLFATIFDTFFGSYVGCYLGSAFLYLVACGTQAGTFALYAEPSFCIDGSHECGVGTHGIQSAVACVFFWLCSVLTCCFPRPDPFCQAYKQQKEEEQQERAAPVETRPVVVVQQGNAEDEKAGKPKTTTRKKRKKKAKEGAVTAGSPASSKRSLKTSNSKKNITKDDFEEETPQVREGVDRMEVKEKSFPDGSRQVDEITHFTDGTKAVKSRNYGPGE